MKPCTGFCVHLLYGHHAWKSCMACLYGNLARVSRVEIVYEINVRTSVGKMLYGSVAWKCCTDVLESCVDILNEHFVWKSCYGNTVWKIGMGIMYGNCLWISCMEIVWGNRVWKLCVEILYGSVVWIFCMEVMCGKYVLKSCMEIFLWKPCMENLYRNRVWKFCMEIVYGNWRPKLATMFAIPRGTGISGGRGNRLEDTGRIARSWQ